MTIKEFVAKAEKGGRRIENIMINGELDYAAPYSSRAPDTISGLLLDPEAWKAVGKVEEWKENMPEVSDSPLSLAEIVITYKTLPVYLYHMHRMIDALAEGKTILEYLETL